jgi:hypothetical protein
MSAVNIGFETGAGRCAWCWDLLPENDTHTVVSAVQSPPLELRFHHQCWSKYQKVTGLAQQIKVVHRSTPIRLY